MKSHGRRLLVTLSSLSCYGCVTPHMNLVPRGTRPFNGKERFYTVVAADFIDSKMCEKISPKHRGWTWAVRSGMSMPAGTEVHHEFRVPHRRSAALEYISGSVGGAGRATAVAAGRARR